MTKRDKRLKKGIDSLDKQISIHEEKRQKAKEKWNIELEGYYEKEIDSLKKYKKRKEKILWKWKEGEKRIGIRISLSLIVQQITQEIKLSY